MSQVYGLVPLWMFMWRTCVANGTVKTTFLRRWIKATWSFNSKMMVLPNHSCDGKIWSSPCTHTDPAEDPSPALGTPVNKVRDKTLPSTSIKFLIGNYICKGFPASVIIVILIMFRIALFFFVEFLLLLKYFHLLFLLVLTGHRLFRGYKVWVTLLLA